MTAYPGLEQTKLTVSFFKVIKLHTSLFQRSLVISKTHKTQRNNEVRIFRNKQSTEVNEPYSTTFPINFLEYEIGETHGFS